MNLNEIINSDTMSQINDYLTLKKPPGLILKGIGGLGKAEAAKFVSAALLGCSEGDLITNPDYFHTDPSKSLKVDDINSLLDMANRSSVGTRKVIVIYNAHTMTIQTQNRLLKLLEDRHETNILIIHTQKDVLIDTISSRCYTINFHPLSDEKMKIYLNKKGVESKYHDFLCFLTQNAPLVIEDKEILKDYLSMFDKMNVLTMRENLLQLFHCLKEKDNAEFYSSHDEHPTWNIRLLLYYFYQMIINNECGENNKYNFPANLYSYEQAYQILLYGIEHLKLAETTYTKNDYFNLIRYIIQIQ